MIPKSLATALCFLAVFVAGIARMGAQNLSDIHANDNRSPAGELQNRILSLRLEIGQGNWHPESDQGAALPMYAFGEAEKSLQAPGPLIRVPQGTEIDVSVHNSLAVAVTVRGLEQRPSNGAETLALPPGATQQVRFQAGEAGTYYYWATTTRASLMSTWTPVEALLAGALIVDSPEATADDRIFVIGLRGNPEEGEILTINGKSWPYTERISFHQGDSAHWRWLNLGVSAHAMHLHGHFFHVDAVGDGRRVQPYAESMPPRLVTHFVAAGGTFDMSFVAEHPGRWLFHCHMVAHMSPQELPPSGGPPVMDEHEHGTEPESIGMAGLVMGITVLAKQGGTPSPAWSAERKLQLILEEQNDARPAYALQVRDQEDAASPSVSPGTTLIGPSMVLTQGQPTEIGVVNHIDQPTAIHWHGMELESYYDGVPGWSGDGQKTHQPIMPGESFTAHLAPPRAGTFIYHTHWHDPRQLTNGIYGPLIVMPPGEEYDPATDLIFLFSMGTFEPFGEMLLLNGDPQPDPLRLAAGTRYRLRLINIAPNNVAMRASLRQAGVPVKWRSIAKDGADLPPAAAITKTAEFPITVGETYDFEYESDMPKELSLEVYLPGPKLRVTQGLVFGASPTE